MAPQQTTARGTVHSIDGSKIWVTVSDSCASSPESSCDSGCGSCGGKTGSRLIMVESGKKEYIAPGSQITIRYYELNELLSALAVFGLPLLGVVLSLVIWYLVAPSRIESVPSLLSAGAGLAAGFFIVKIIDRAIRNKYPSEILSRSAAAPLDSDV